MKPIALRTVRDSQPVPVMPAPKKEKSPKKMGVVAQVREAFKAKNRLATSLGCLLGGIVPLASYVLAHFEIASSTALWWQLNAWLVLGGLLYSAKTVFDWGRLAFQLPIKAFGFVVLLEGVMIASKTPWLGYTALGYLVLINGVATGCTLSLERAEKTEK